MKYVTTATITIEVPDEDVDDWTLEAVEANIMEAVSDSSVFIEHGEYVHLETAQENSEPTAPVRYIGYTSARGRKAHANARCGTGRAFISNPYIVDADADVCGRCGGKGLMEATEENMVKAANGYAAILRRYHGSSYTPEQYRKFAQEKLDNLKKAAAR